MSISQKEGMHLPQTWGILFSDEYVGDFRLTKNRSVAISLSLSLCNFLIIKFKYPAN